MRGRPFLPSRSMGGASPESSLVWFALHRPLFDQSCMCHPWNMALVAAMDGVAERPQVAVPGQAGAVGHTRWHAPTAKNQWFIA